MKLKWKDHGCFLEARLGTPDDGVTFTISHHPTCYRRGPWKLLVEVCGGEHHEKWGCFDEQDQPVRWFHSCVSAWGEAERIAEVLERDRHRWDQKELQAMRVQPYRSVLIVFREFGVLEDEE